MSFIGCGNGGALPSRGGASLQPVPKNFSHEWALTKPRRHQGAADVRRTLPSLRQQGLACARVLIVVPYAEDDPAGASVSVAELVAVLNEDAGGE